MKGVNAMKNLYEQPYLLIERLSDDVLTLVSGGAEAARDYVDHLNISSLF